MDIYTGHIEAEIAIVQLLGHLKLYARVLYSIVYSLGPDVVEIA